MIVDERLTAYLHSLESTGSPVLERVRKEALAADVPIIRPETGALLRTLIRLQRPMRLLEVGTATGYSAIMMGECLAPGASITTIENYEKRIPIARANIAAAGMSDRIRLLEGDALKVMADLTPGFDMIFMDAAKGQYIHFLPHVRRLLKSGGLLISDNVLQEGDIAMSRYAVTRRNRTIHSRMRDYIWELKHSDDFETAILTVGDGVALSTKISRPLKDTGETV